MVPGIGYPIFFLKKKEEEEEKEEEKNGCADRAFCVDFIYFKIPKLGT